MNTIEINPNKINALHIKMVIIITIFIIFSALTITNAGEAIPDSSPILISTTHHKDNLILESINENHLIISGVSYIVTNQTKIEFLDNKKKPVTPKQLRAKLTPPYYVHITYRQYQTASEGKPFISSDKVLEKILIIKSVNNHTPKMHNNYSDIRR